MPCPRLRVLLPAIVLLALCRTCFAGSPVSFEEMSVTATFPGSIYIEKAERSYGIRVNTTKTFTEGDVVNVSGTLETDPLTDERYVAAYPEYPQGAGSTLVLKPLGLVNRAFTGGDSALQNGVDGDGNLNNVGLLVTIWGPVSAFDDPVSPVSWFKIGGGPEVKVVVPSGVTIDTEWAFVVVTGISCIEKDGGSTVRVLKVRRQGDIVSRQSWSAIRLKTMTLDEKVGQLFQIRIDGDTLDEPERLIIEQKHVGGVIYFQYNGNLDDPVRSAQMSNDLQECAIGTNGTGIPLLISMDQEGGRVTRITGGAEFPGNMGCGASRDTAMAYSTGRVFGEEIRAVGGNMDLAPVLDVNNNPANPVIGVRSFGEEPALASAMGQAYLEGLHSSGVIATGKHFPGHGDTAVDSHSGLPIVTYDFATLDNIHGKPFRDAIADGLDAIMTAHIVVTCLDPDHPATLSPAVVDGYLRGDLGFNGVVMTDSMGMAGITSGYGVAESSVLAIKAGCDLLSLSPDLDTAWNAVKSAVLSGDITQARLDQAVERILALKHRKGIFANPYVDPDAADGIVGSTEHWNAELAAARAAVTLVQNTSDFLPLDLTPSQKILLVTVEGAETTTDASSRFAAYITAKHSNVQSLPLVVNPNSSQRATVKTAASSAYVTIIGTSRAQLSSNVGQATLVNDLVAMGKPVVVVGLREPYELASFPGVNAYVAAYNYRNCGFQAAADALFGDLNPSGLLPVTIPGLYAYGHGLSY